MAECLPDQTQKNITSHDDTFEIDWMLREPFHYMLINNTAYTIENLANTHGLNSWKGLCAVHSCTCVQYCNMHGICAFIEYRKNVDLIMPLAPHSWVDLNVWRFHLVTLCCAKKIWNPWTPTAQSKQGEMNEIFFFELFADMLCSA